MRRLSRAMAEESVPPPPAELNEKIGRRLDEATVVRPSRWRFAVPATIAATISAIGILVAVQWREGRLTPPEVEDKKTDDARPAAPPPMLPMPPMREESLPSGAKERTDEVGAREKDLDVQASPMEELPQAPADSEVGGFADANVGSVEKSVEEGTGGAHENRERASEAPQSALTADQAQPGRLLQKQASAAPAPTPAAKADAATPCADRWSDSGARGTWEVADPVAAAHELDTIVLDVGGTGLWRGIDDGRPYQLIVPRSRYLEVFYALRARGIAGFVDPPALDVGDDCTALSITIVHAR
jgi:hypothetical protein